VGLKRSVKSVKKWAKVAQYLVRGLGVNEAQVAAHLKALREQLPTTEAILIGKPQAGKSSLVRGLTGQPANIVGQGFQPHTRHTQRYAYPSDALPLLIFTDTVGLGDAGQNMAELVQALRDTVDQDPNRARIFVLTVKVTDFATDALHQVMTVLRQQYPHVPCLLAVTCLHELYESPTDNHPPYPPQLKAIDRAMAELKGNFDGLWDHALPLDFTLEEDGYDPPFYGLAALKRTLARVLPQAESQAIHQLLAEEEEKGAAISNLYRRAARQYIKAFAVAAGVAAAVPLPFATMPVLTSLQVSMVVVLGRLYNQPLSLSQGLGVVSSLAGGFVAQAVGRELVKFIPIAGSAIATTWSVAYTWALGEGACLYFGDLLAGKVPDPEAIQALMARTYARNKGEQTRQGTKSASAKSVSTKSVSTKSVSAKSVSAKSVSAKSAIATTPAVDRRPTAEGAAKSLASDPAEERPIPDPHQNSRLENPVEEVPPSPLAETLQSEQANQEAPPNPSQEPSRRDENADAST
jgi:uncharacterized protein (DUF697 family)/GTP-binding protein EngB required for normal cell division